MLAVDFTVLVGVQLVIELNLVRGRLPVVVIFNEETPVVGKRTIRSLYSNKYMNSVWTFNIGSIQDYYMYLTFLLRSA